MTPLPTMFAGAAVVDCMAPNVAARQAVEILIDDITEQSFPASDSPAWGTASARLKQALWRIEK